MISVDCPRFDCPGEVEFDVAQDSDDGGAAHGLHSNTWFYADAKSDSCTEGHVIADHEWAALVEKADALIAKGDR